MVVEEAAPPEVEQASTFRDLFVAHHGRLHRYANQLLRDREMAGDAVQDVFVRLWERRDRWDAQRDATPYLYRAVRHRAFDLARHRGVVRRHADAPAAADVRDGAPDDALHLAELRRAVAGAVENLPPRQREVFVLSRQGGWTYAEIADALGVSVKTVEKRMSAAFRALVVALSPYQ